jgi:very-short-patch-repair endonuclease
MLDGDKDWPPLFQRGDGVMPVRHFRNIRCKEKPWKQAKAKEMAKNLTLSEAILWARLKEKKIGVWVHKQKTVMGYIIDFWCPAAGLAIEVDGPSHLRQRAWDKKRDAVLKSKGIMTMRFLNAEVENSTNAVEALIRSRVAKRLK